MTGEPLTADDMLDRLAVRFPIPEWAFIPQVPNGTLYSKTRTADALAFNCWKSRGMEIHGFEIKVARYDWLRELRDPEKAEAMMKYCDRWWIVADKGVVGPGELPPTWGLMVPRSKGLHVEVEAPKLSPKGPDIYFLAAVMRRAVEVVTPQSRIEVAYKRGVTEGRKQEKEERRSDNAYQLEQIREAVKKFEDASGVRIRDPWTAGDVGSAVKSLINLPHAIGQVRYARQSAARAVEMLDEALKDQPPEESQ